jgi:hypothetical protein
MAPYVNAFGVIGCVVTLCGSCWLWRASRLRSARRLALAISIAIGGMLVGIGVSDSLNAKGTAYSQWIVPALCAGMAVQVAKGGRGVIVGVALILVGIFLTLQYKAIMLDPNYTGNPSLDAARQAEVEVNLQLLKETLRNRRDLGNLTFPKGPLPRTLKDAAREALGDDFVARGFVTTKTRAKCYTFITGIYQVERRQIRIIYPGGRVSNVVEAISLYDENVK